VRSAPRPQPACYNALPSGDSGLAFRLRSFLRGDGTPPPSRGNGLLDYVHPAWDAPQKKRRCLTICCNIGHRAEKSVGFMLWNLQRPGLTGCCSGAPITRSRVIPGRQSDVRERGSSPRPAGASARSWTERPSMELPAPVSTSSFSRAMAVVAYAQVLLQWALERAS
jgi:hypothetical protein